ncbi:hypothetical protein [Actinokineospora fastidiosa]|uniref:Uncharacterized protein n=1 Tax=Actinokineospora fastidiosa TaxID=1816 RepID=A0A918GTT1_9PSEU|nr:hypothetical protein [Actinokineospora fastidiosa]GGS57844.1 hypothetical protein GCM10010171_61060 [Actinokineospora fastidiosa]
MDTSAWIRGPVGREARDRLTRTDLKAVLVLVQTVTAANRLADVLPVFDGDHRVQPVYTVPRGADTWYGVETHVRSLGGLVMPWEQSVRLEWDLVVSACREGIEQVHGNLLMLPHGAGAGKSRARSRMCAATEATTGLDREMLTHRGRILPAAIALPTESDRELLSDRCPEALDRAFVAGDPCLDRLVASRVHREQYRAALNVAAERPLLVVSSTWSPESAFGRHPGLCDRLLDELPAHRAAVILHPNIWAVHGAATIRGWLARAIARGLLVIPPERGWQGALLAADVVIGDHGSTTAYAAALGARVVLATAAEDNLRPGSVADRLRRSVPSLDHRRPLAPQLAEARCANGFAAAVSTQRGVAHERVRAVAYRLLGLAEPPWPARIGPVPLPEPLPW